MRKFGDDDECEDLDKTLVLLNRVWTEGVAADPRRLNCLLLIVANIVHSAVLHHSIVAIVRRSPRSGMACNRNLSVHLYLIYVVLFFESSSVDFLDVYDGTL